MSRRTLILTIFLGAIILIATAQGDRLMFQGDPAASAWYTDTSIANPWHESSDFWYPSHSAHPTRDMSVYDNVNVFARANNGSLLWCRFPKDQSLSPIVSVVKANFPGYSRPLAVYIDSSLCAIQRGPNTIDVFYLTDRYSINHLTWDGRQWSCVDPDLAYSRFGGGVSATSWGPDRIDLFFPVYSEHEPEHEPFVAHKSWDGSVWRDEPNLGSLPGVWSIQPAAASWGPNNLEVIVKGQDNSYYRNSYGVGGFGGWQAIPGGTFSSSPCITATPPFPSGGGDRAIRIFGRGMDHKLYGRAYDAIGTPSAPWGDVGGNLNSAPTVINYVGNHFTAFAKGPDNTLWMLDWDAECCDPEDYYWGPIDFEVRSGTSGAAGPIVTEEQPSIMQMVNNTNIPGSDYKDFDLKVADPKLCAQACIDDPVCVACTYVNPGYQGANARCWLKNNVASQVRDECCLSGVKNISVVMPQIVPPQPVGETYLGAVIPEVPQQPVLQQPEINPSEISQPGLAAPAQPDKVPSAIDKNGHLDGGVSGNNIKFPQLGNRIKVNETGQYFGEWTRIDGTDTFNAVWNGQITDVIEVQSIEGNQVTLYRQGNGGYYYGTLNGDGTITGTASWYEPNWKWSGTIEKTFIEKT